jgi:penicillin-binding protein-related factor A (putative recombinase)
MAKTPEGVTKELTKAFLHERFIFNASKATNFPENAQGWYYFASQNGFGVSGISDLVGHYKGIFFSLELKAPDRRGQKFRGCSPHQHYQLEAIRNSGGVAYVVDGLEDLEEFWRCICSTTK